MKEIQTLLLAVFFLVTFSTSFSYSLTNDDNLKIITTHGKIIFGQLPKGPIPRSGPSPRMGDSPPALCRPLDQKKLTFGQLPKGDFPPPSGPSARMGDSPPAQRRPLDQQKLTFGQLPKGVPIPPSGHHLLDINY
ncbi:hypothetical protein ACS0TY_027377 [Phlomoides rotata]